MPKAPRISELAAREQRIVKNLHDLLGKLRPASEVWDLGKHPEKEMEMRAGSMADVMKLVAGIRYLVEGWIPLGMLTMILAPPGAGKSAFVLCALVRTVILGGQRWFTGRKGPPEPGFVLWCDTEGTAAITVQRIKDWGLPAEKIKVPFADDPLRAINLTNSEHLERIRKLIERHAIRLVVIDSLRGAHDGDENNSRVAQVLQNLAEVAQATGAAIILIHHTRKLQLDEEMSDNASRGSNAITAMVRSQLGIHRPDENSDWRKLQMLKENLGLKPRPVGFRISSRGVEFGPAPEKPQAPTEKNRAEEWLRANMRPGRWHKSGDLLEHAEQDGFSTNAIFRAKVGLGIRKPNVQKTKAGWEWRLPATKEEFK